MLSLLCSAAMERAKVLITMKHGMARLDNVWGVGGGQRPVMFLISKVRRVWHKHQAQPKLRKLEQMSIFLSFVDESFTDGVSVIW